MKITLDVPDHKVPFILEVLQAFSYVKAKPSRPRKAPPMDETEYLLSTEANRKELLESIAQIRAGQAQLRDLIEE